jgi:hypothetical protein
VSKAPSVRRAPLLYRLVLWLAWPARERRAQSAELEQMFLHCVAESRRRRGWPGVVLAWLRGMADAMGAGIFAWAELFAARGRMNGGRSMGRLSLSGIPRELVSDVRLAARALVRDRLFTATALLTLLVCLAANAAIFSIVRSVLLKPLPIPEADRIVLLSNIYPRSGPPRTGPGASGTSAPDYFDRLEGMTVFEEQATYQRLSASVELADGVERTVALRATPSFFALVRARPLRGTLFREQDGEFDAAPRAILSYGYWQRAFGGEEAVIGRDVRINGVAFHVIGVLPRDFQFIWNDVDLWLPLGFAPALRADSRRHSNNWNMIARLKPDATVAQAQAEVDAINARPLERFPQFRSIIIDSANLLLVRSAGRVREMAIRQTLGAGPLRLGRQLLTETTFLTLLGGVLGIAAAW